MTEKGNREVVVVAAVVGDKVDGGLKQRRLVMVADQEGLKANLKGDGQTVKNAVECSPHPSGWQEKISVLGTIANEIGNLSALRYIYLDSNSFTGRIPNGIGKLSSLRTLDLHSNGLTGSIPNEVGNLSAIQYLNFGFNILTGTYTYLPFS
ncbi:uncharacterized protein Fot_29573 [Forsythia ovata]